MKINLEWSRKGIDSMAEKISRDGQCAELPALVCLDMIVTLQRIVKELRQENNTLQSLVPHRGDGSCEQCGAAPASPVETMLCHECQKLATWRKELPDEQALWWWWNEDGLPIPVSILFSGTYQRYFASVGQHGWNRTQWVEDMGGYWMRCFEPPYPSV